MKLREGPRSSVIRWTVLLTLGAGVVGLVAVYKYIRYTPGVLAFFPVEGMFDPIADRPFDMTEDGQLEVFRFRHLYGGSHWIGLAVDRPPWIGVHFEHDFAFDIRILDGDAVLLQASVSEPELPFWGNRPLAGGVVLKTYEVPRDAPRKKWLTCEVKLTNADPEFSQRYGPVRLVIAKLSDK